MSHSPHVPALLACVLALAGTALQSARAADDFFDSDAQTPSPITDRFALRASFFHPSVTTNMRLDPPGEPLGGTNLSGARDLGFKTVKNDGLAQLMFRLRDRNRVTADYLELDQAGTATQTRPLVFGTQVLHAGDVLGTNLQWRATGLTWTYAFIQNDRLELGAGLGVHLMDLDVRGNVPTRFANYETSTAGVLPTPAIDAAWRITRRISLTAQAQYLRAATNGTSGAFGDFHADAQFRLVPSFAVGAGYSIVKLNLDSSTQANPGSIGMRLHGPEVFVRVSF